MNIYDLDKIATPEPWPTDISESVGGEGGTTCAESNANERLSRHCRNNFFKALEALKEELAERMETYTSAMADDRDRTDADERTDFLRALIAELEEVK